MRRPFDPHYEKLNAEKSRLEAELKNTKPGPLRKLLLRKLGLIETTLRIDDWATSAGLRAPEQDGFSWA